jgi:signal transduction histidine kinase
VGDVETSIDVGKVERILENLLRNAAKHTPTGTPILVRVTGGPDGATVSVEDEGPGIPADMKEFLFQPFRQGAAARATGAGVGIGLSFVAKFAELHGGVASVEDRPGGGTAFRVFLPDKGPAVTATAPQELPAQTRYGASLAAS